MTEFLLDTNVISEMTRDDPNRNVVAFLDRTETMWVPSIVIHELEYGLRLLPQGQRRRRLYAMQSGILAAYQDRILPLNREMALNGRLGSGRRPDARGILSIWETRLSPEPPKFAASRSQPAM